MDYSRRIVCQDPLSNGIDAFQPLQLYVFRVSSPTSTRDVWCLCECVSQLYKQVMLFFMQRCARLVEPFVKTSQTETERAIREEMALT